MAIQAMMPTIQLACRPDGPLGATAHQAEGGIHRRNSLAAGDEPGGTAPDEQAAERDDEGRHVEEGDDRALERADRGADGDAAGKRDDPDGGMLEPEILRQDLDLHDAP